MDLFAKVKNLKPADFKPQFGKLLSEAESKVKAFEEQSTTALADTAGDYSKFQTAVDSAQQELLKVAEQVGDKFTKGKDASQEAFDAAMKSVSEARGELKSYLSGNEVKNVKAPELLTQAFTAAEEAAKKVTGKTDSLFGMGKTQGWRKALDHNIKGMNVFDGKVIEGRKGAAFGRVGAVTVGAGLMADSIIRGKTSNGEDRSAVTRIIEFVAGGSVAAGGLFAGKAI